MRFPFRQLHDLTDAQRNFEFLEQSGVYWGAGAPAFRARSGSVYFRTDTPTVANQFIYANTSAAGTIGSTWTGKV